MRKVILIDDNGHQHDITQAVKAHMSGLVDNHQVINHQNGQCQQHQPSQHHARPSFGGARQMPMGVKPQGFGGARQMPMGVKPQGFGGNGHRIGIPVPIGVPSQMPMQGMPMPGMYGMPMYGMPMQDMPDAMPMYGMPMQCMPDGMPMPGMFPQGEMYAPVPVSQMRGDNGPDTLQGGQEWDAPQGGYFRMPIPEPAHGGHYQTYDNEH